MGLAYLYTSMLDKPFSGIGILYVRYTIASYILAILGKMLSLSLFFYLSPLLNSKWEQGTHACTKITFKSNNNNKRSENHPLSKHWNEYCTVNR